MTDNTNQNNRMHSDPSYNTIREIEHHIRKLMQAGYLYTKELNKNYQVSAPQLSCLITLYENGPMPPSQIAKHMMVKPSTVTGVIDRLEYKGFVTRKRVSADRRIITIELTEAGSKRAENAPPPVQQKIVEGLKRLSEEKLEQIATDLKTLTHMLDVTDFDVEHHDDPFLS